VGLRVSVPVAPDVRASGNPGGLLALIMVVGITIWAVKTLLAVWWVTLPAAFVFCMYMARHAERRLARIRANQSQAAVSNRR
jgi:Flp pilus assembly protein TadB